MEKILASAGGRCRWPPDLETERAAKFQLQNPFNWTFGKFQVLGDCTGTASGTCRNIIMKSFVTMLMMID